MKIVLEEMEPIEEKETLEDQGHLHLVLAQIEVMTLEEPSLLEMDDILSPRNAQLGRGRNDDNQGSRLLTARSIRAEFNRSTAKRVKKSNENFISAGPPMLQESPINKNFYKW